MSFRLLTTIVLFVCLFPGCDTVETTDPPDDGSVEFDGVTYVPVGQAELRQTSDGLVVENLGSSGNDGVRVQPDSPVQQADVRVQEVGLPAGAEWGLRVFGQLNGQQTALATAWSESMDGALNQFTFDFAPALAVQFVAMNYYLNGELVFSTELPNNGQSQARETPAGSGEDGPQSVHVIRNGGVLIVATDFGGEAPKNTHGCTAALLEVFDIEGQPRQVCTDYVEAMPIGEFNSAPDATSYTVTGGDVSSFTITGGSVR
ncbi:MAG: hypothetical protein R3284_01860 [Rubricoccaceae bacterium]|nr:hypothetical protein [Rubricoccaceae bacterium]